MEGQLNKQALDAAIQAAINETISSGIIEEAVKKSLNSAVEEAVAKSFGYDSEAKKLIEERIGLNVLNAIERFDFSAYDIKINTMLEAVLQHTLIPRNAKILENFKQLMDPGEIVKISVDELFEAYKEYVKTYMDGQATDDDPCGDTGTRKVDVEMEITFDGDDLSRRPDYTINFRCPEEEDLSMKIRLWTTQNFRKNSYKNGVFPDHVAILSPNASMGLMFTNLAAVTKFDILIWKLYRDQASVTGCEYNLGVTDDTVEVEA